MQIGRFLLLCINSDKNTTSSSTEQDNDNQDLMRFIGVFVLSIICLLQYFSPGFGRRMNKTLAVIKLAFMVALFIVGIAATGRKTDIVRSKDWRVWYGDDDKRSDLTFAKALLLVLFSFQGWENATFGFIAAVCTVGCLYLLIVAVFVSMVVGLERGVH
ncbi:hypothetical protein Neosp_010092 [[Neocosmospora] mangrovei]